MKTLRLLALILVGQGFLGLATHSVADTFGSGDNQFTIDFVPIGNPGNAADATGSPNPAGSVPYVYNIAKYEISRDMVTKASAEGGLGITLGSIPSPDMPATGVSWNEAARFVNWLNTSQGFSPAYKFTTQPEDLGYDTNANISLWNVADSFLDVRGVNRFRNKDARYFLPSVDEWYKAAYYDPNANGGIGHYWDYPTGSNSAPTGVASGTGAGTAVYLQPFSQGPADITQAGGLSPYGVMGLGGNVWEWEESEWDLGNDSPSSVRGMRGGIWANDLAAASNLSSPYRFSNLPAFEYVGLGFRVASVPESSSLLLGLLGLLALLGTRRPYQPR